MKKQLTHYDAHDLSAIKAGALLREDAGESIFFARQLEYVKGQAYDVKYPPLSAMALIPVSTEVPAGAETITYTQYDQVGAAKIIANYADDLPRADVSGKQFTSPIRGIGISYGYNLQEIRAAQMANANIDSRKMRAAMRGHEELVNKLAWNGDAVTGLPGLLSNTNISEYVLPNNTAGTSKKWADKTADEILDDMNGIANSINTLTKGVHRPNEMWLPLAAYSLISTRPRSTQSDTTILEFFLKNQPFITSVKPVLEMVGAGAGGTDRMFVGEINAENLQMEIPMMFQQHAPQVRGLEYVVPCESRFGGVIVRYPLAFAFADGI
ncbi:MAG: DUF2184 domain-containing protein [Burkholderiaceae bacterium]